VTRSNQKGVALLITLILVLVLSVMTASMMFLSQSETWSSLNYRLMTQGRYGAEAGLHAAANYLINPSTGYPGIGSSDPITAYNINVSPVTAGGNPVVLSSLSGVSANYPASAVKSAFASASTGSLTAGSNTVNYTASAQLLSMKQIIQCGNAQPLVAQLWKLTSHGDIGGVRKGEVEVSALLESHIVPCYKYAAFATGTGCGAINWSGGGPIDSYDSSTASGGTVSTQEYDGNVGSNGNANIASHTSVTGTFSSPETGVGACSSGDAVSGVTQAQLPNYVENCETGPPPVGQSYCSTTGNVVPLSQSVTYPTPTTSYPTGVVESTLPSSSGNLTPGNTAGCTGGVGCYGDISNSITLMPNWNGIAVGQPGYSCTGATYYVNTLSLNGSKSLTLGTCPDGSYQPIVLNIVDVNNSGSPISIGGGSIANASLNPALLQIQYAGTGSIKVHGGSTAAACLYAPNAPVELDGANSSWYGALITNTLTLNGNGASIHWDRRLANNAATVGNWTMDTFTWSKY
jgi:Tfp pilus assembly protein PilX